MKQDLSHGFFVINELYQALFAQKESNILAYTSDGGFLLWQTIELLKKINLILVISIGVPDSVVTRS